MEGEPSDTGPTIVNLGKKGLLYAYLWALIRRNWGEIGAKLASKSSRLQGNVQISNYYLFKRFHF